MCFSVPQCNVHVVLDSMLILFQPLLQLVLEASGAFRAKMEGFKCALGKLLALRPCGTPGQQHSIYCRLELPSSVAQSPP